MGIWVRVGKSYSKSKKLARARVWCLGRLIFDGSNNPNWRTRIFNAFLPPYSPLSKKIGTSRLNFLLPKILIYIHHLNITYASHHSTFQHHTNTKIISLTPNHIFISISFFYIEKLRNIINQYEFQRFIITEVLCIAHYWISYDGSFQGHSWSNHGSFPCRSSPF